MALDDRKTLPSYREFSVSRIWCRVTYWEKREKIFEELSEKYTIFFLGLHFLGFARLSSMGRSKFFVNVRLSLFWFFFFVYLFCNFPHSRILFIRVRPNFYSVGVTQSATSGPMLFPFGPKRQYKMKHGSSAMVSLRCLVKPSTAQRRKNLWHIVGVSDGRFSSEHGVKTGFVFSLIVIYVPGVE